MKHSCLEVAKHLFSIAQGPLQSLVKFYHQDRRPSSDKTHSATMQTILSLKV